METGFFHKFSKHQTQRNTPASFLLLIKKKNKHEVLVIWAGSKNKLRILKNSRKPKEVTDLSGKIFISKSGNPGIKKLVNNMLI